MSPVMCGILKNHLEILIQFPTSAMCQKLAQDAIIHMRTVFNPGNPNNICGMFSLEASYCIHLINTNLKQIIGYFDFSEKLWIQDIIFLLCKAIISQKNNIDIEFVNKPLKLLENENISVNMDNKIKELQRQVKATDY